MSKWTQEQRDNACIGLAQQGLEVGTRTLSDGNLEHVIDLACQRNELLEALKEAVPHMEYKRSHTQTVPAMKAVSRSIERAKAAIDKAEGK